MVAITMNTIKMVRFSKNNVGHLVTAIEYIEILKYLGGEKIIKNRQKFRKKKWYEQLTLDKQKKTTLNCFTVTKCILIINNGY